MEAVGGLSVELAIAVETGSEPAIEGIPNGGTTVVTAATTLVCEGIAAPFKGVGPGIR